MPFLRQTTFSVVSTSSWSRIIPISSASGLRRSSSLASRHALRSAGSGPDRRAVGRADVVPTEGARPVTTPPRPDLAALLDLAPHPEGGWFRETWRSAHRFRPEGYDGLRDCATAIYFLLAPGEESRWHVVRSDELWLWHSGGPLTLRF